MATIQDELFRHPQVGPLHILILYACTSKMDLHTTARSGHVGASRHVTTVNNNSSVATHWRRQRDSSHIEFKQIAGSSLPPQCW